MKSRVVLSVIFQLEKGMPLDLVELRPILRTRVYRVYAVFM